MKIKDLVKVLLEKDQEKDVQFIICTENQEIVAMDVSTTSKDMTRILKLFK